MKLPKGPALRRLLPIQQELVEDGKAVITETDYFGYTQKRVLALMEMTK